MKKIIIDRYNKGQTKFFYFAKETHTEKDVQTAIAEGRTLIYAETVPTYELFSNPKYGWLKTFHDNIKYQQEMYQWYQETRKDENQQGLDYLYTEYIMGNLDGPDNDLLLKPILDFMEYKLA